MTTLEKIDMSATLARNINRVESNLGIQQRQEIVTVGKSAPVAKPATTSLETKKKEIDQAVKHVAGYVQNITRELNFSVDEELDRFIVTVLDQETGEIIRQIPSEEMLELARTLADAQENAPGGQVKGILFQGRV